MKIPFISRLMEIKEAQLKLEKQNRLILESINNILQEIRTEQRSLLIDLNHHLKEIKDQTKARSF